MAYLVTAKSSGIELRDGALASDPMHKLAAGVPVLFHNMPCGYRLPGDGQVSIELAPESAPPAPPKPIPMDITPVPASGPAPEAPRRKKRRA